MADYYPQGQIALPIEQKAKELLNVPHDVLNVREQFFSADQIWAGNFVEVMFFLLKIRDGYELNLREFAIECQSWFGVPLKDKPQEKATALYNKFMKMLENEEHPQSKREE